MTRKLHHRNLIAPGVHASLRVSLVWQTEVFSVHNPVYQIEFRREGSQPGLQAVSESK